MRRSRSSIVGPSRTAKTPGATVGAGLSRGPWRLIALAAVVALGALSGYREIFGPDVGFHLASGRWITEHAAWPDRDAFTWTVKNPYVDMQWLYQVALWSTFRLGDGLGAVLFNIGLTLASAGLLAWRSATRQGRLPSAVAPLLLMFLLGDLWEVRPHVASWLLFNGVLLALERHAQGHTRSLRALPLLMLVWVNAHSLFVLGLAAIAIHAAASWLVGRAADRRLLSWGGAAAAACLLNPYGITGLLFPLRQLGEIHAGSVFDSEVTGVAELRSPFSLQEYTANGAFVLLQPIIFMHLYLLAMVGAFAYARRRLPLADWMLAAAFGYLFWKAEKNFGYFVVATMPAVAQAWGGLEGSLRGRRRLPIGSALTVLVCLVIGLQTVSGWRYAQERLPFRLGHAMSDAFLPVRACSFLKERVPPGRLLNSWDDGGYVHLATRWPVFIDSRGEVMGDDFFRSYLRLKSPATISTELARWDPEIVLVPVHFLPQWVSYFGRDPAWRCVYSDEQSVIYLRRSFAPSVPDRLAARAGVDYEPLGAGRTDAILDRALRLEEPSMLETLVGPHHYPLRELRLTAVHLSLKEPDAALAHGLRGLERATIACPDLINNVMLAFIGTGDLARAARCFAALPPSLRDERVRRMLDRAGAPTTASSP